MRFCFPFIISQRYICVPNLNLCPSNDKFGNTTFPHFYEENFSKKTFLPQSCNACHGNLREFLSGGFPSAETTLEIGWFLSRGYYFYFRFATPGVSQTGEGYTDHILWLFFLCLILSLEPLATFYLYFIITEIKNL